MCIEDMNGAWLGEDGVGVDGVGVDVLQSYISHCFKFHPTRPDFVSMT